MTLSGTLQIHVENGLIFISNIYIKKLDNIFESQRNRQILSGNLLLLILPANDLIDRTTYLNIFDLIRDKVLIDEFPR